MQDIPESIQSAQQVVTHAAVLRALTTRHIEEHRQQPQHAFSAAPHFQFNFENFQQNGAHTVIGLIPMLMKVIHWLVTGTLVLTLSFLTYFVFYRAVMPAPAASEPLYFDYTQTATPTFVYSPHQSDDIDAKNPTTCFHPWAAIDLFAKHTAWDAIATNDVLPKPKAQTRVLDAGHAYYIETLLELPESHFNRNSGMFGVVVELWSSNGKMLAVSRRSTRFPNASPWIDVMYKFVRILGFLVDALKETKVIVLSSFSNFVESPDLPLVSLLTCQLLCAFGFAFFLIDNNFVHFYTGSGMSLSRFCHGKIQVIQEGRVVLKNLKGNHHRILTNSRERHQWKSSAAQLRLGKNIMLISK